jgi:iron-sulfur cluster assembly protein
MEFDTTLGAKDKSFEMHGSKVVVDDQSLLYLLGLTLDFEGGLNGKGFVFSNPNATKTCGCGTSFNV